MTTDTFPKAVSKQVKIGETTVTIQGIAKGSGMVAPDMATMLAFITTDARIGHDALQTLVSSTVETSFNSITVDSDTSTSDMVLAFATGAAANDKVRDVNDPSFADFRRAFADTMQELAIMIVKDGEGLSKLIQIDVSGGVDSHSARRIGLAVANSPLVKTAISGEDANWGRIVMAVGKSGEPANRDTLSVGIGGHWIARNGMLLADYEEAPIQKHLHERHVTIQIDLGLGNGAARIWGCDLTHGYVDINGSYRS
ncbi:Arginine biosynthesis bifunctional protein ArgJ [Acetobacteraceae bacterium EV16P]|uniref:Arginine biosynthesis bifunctional protein ArgJ n=2 Tax=Sorlinia euscelidii TaxID=3081148 RepID=A0ABU7U1F6_9PROT